MLPERLAQRSCRAQVEALELPAFHALQLLQKCCRGVRGKRSGLLLLPRRLVPPLFGQLVFCEGGRCAQNLHLLRQLLDLRRNVTQR